MKYGYLILAALLVCGVVIAAQDTTLTERELRDPKQLEPWLEANASDAETRLAAIEGGTATVTQDANTLLVGNDASNQVAMAVTGDVTISQDGTNVTTAIAAGVIVNADVKSDAAIAASKLDADLYEKDGIDLLTEGYFDVVNTTQLVFIATGVTNVIDADITN